MSCGCGCLGSGFGCAPPLLTRVLGCVCVFVWALGLCTATPGLGVRCMGWESPGTCSCEVVRCGLCALPGFAAPGDGCCLAPVLVPWFWPAACLSGMPCGPALVRRASSGAVALGAPVGCPDAGVRFPTPEACTPGFTGRLRGARGGRLRTRLFGPARDRCQGSSGHRPRRTSSGPRDGVVFGGSLRRRSWAACAAVVCVCGPGLRRVRFPVLSVFRRGTRPVHRGCFVWAPTPPLSGRRTPRPDPVRACACLPLLAGLGGPASRARFGAPHLFLWPFPVLSLFAWPPPGPSCPACGCSCVCSVRTPCLWPSVYSGPGCLGPWRLEAPPPCFVFFPFFFLPPPACFFYRRLGFFFSLFSFFFLCLSVLVVRCLAGVSWAVGCVGLCCCGPCASAGAGARLRSVIRCSRPVPPPFVLLPVALRVPDGALLAALLPPLLPLVGVCGVAYPHSSGSLSRFFFSCVCRLCAGCAPPPPGRLWCPVLCFVMRCVVWCCGLLWFCDVPGVLWRACVWLGSCAVLFGGMLCWVPLCGSCCALLSCAAAFPAGFFLALFLAFPWCSGLLLFLCSACAVLCWCACLLLTVRCSLASAALAGVLCCCLLCLRLCCCAWLSSVVFCGSRWLLVSCFGGVLWCVSGFCAAPCCCPLCRLTLCCCALCCFVLLCLVLSRAVSCPAALSVVLRSCAFRRCVLSCLPVLCVSCCGLLLRRAVTPMILAAVFPQNSKSQQKGVLREKESILLVSTAPK